MDHRLTFKFVGIVQTLFLPYILCYHVCLHLSPIFTIMNLSFSDSWVVWAGIIQNNNNFWLNI